MPYYIKDPNLAECLRKLDKDFDKHLEESCHRQYGAPNDIVVVYADTPTIYSINIYKDSIEYVEDYNASKWNEYPKVTPPEGVIMRVEGDYDYRGVAVFREGEWLFANSMEKTPFGRYIKRFRPWDD